jgi:hypothetical protein
MNDNDIFALVIGIIRDALMAQSISANVRQSNQPRQQGTPTQNTVLIQKIYNKRYGFLSRSDVWDDVNEVIVHTEKQWIEATYQISTLAIQDPNDSTLLTASGLANLVAQIMQTDSTLAALRAQNVGIYRVIDIRNPFFTDDKERFEASPSFDFTVTYEQVYISETPVLQSTEFNIVPV